MTVEIFKTNIECPLIALSTAEELTRLFPHYRVCFDLEDCDRIMKVAANGTISSESILAFVRSKNYTIELLA